MSLHNLFTLLRAALAAFLLVSNIATAQTETDAQDPPKASTASAPAQAPEDPVAENRFDFAAFEALSERAAGVIERNVASDAALSALRGQLSRARTGALAEQELTSAAVVSAQERLDALGPKPEDADSEDADLAALRKEVTEALSAARAPYAAAEEAYLRANALIGQIDDLRRQGSVRRLMELGPTPVNPGLWPKTWAVLAQYSKQIRNEVENAFASDTRAATRLGNLPVILALLAVALMTLIRGRYWLRHILRRMQTTARPRVAAVYAVIGTLAQLVVPIIGLMALQQAISLSDIFDLRGFFLLSGLIGGAITLYAASWLARALLEPAAPLRPLVEVPSERRTQLWRAVMLLGLTFAGFGLIRAMERSDAMEPGARAVLMFPLVVLGGLALIRIGWRKAALRPDPPDAYEGSPLAGRLGRWMSFLAVAAGVMGPVLSLIGYQAAGSQLVFSTAASLLLIAALYILFTFLTLFAPISNVSDSADGPTRGALFGVAAAFVLICAGLPVLALIWGARVSDLQELWIYLRDGISLGETRLSLTDALAFVLIFSIGYTITRLLQSSLRSTVLPNTRLDPGARNAIVTGTGYVGIFFTALAAISSTGLDLSNLAIVAGALSVGIGFGLQTIVSNFVSGIILLIERPIKEGDWIDAGGASGYVRSINVRATEVETFDRATVVIPNADLIANAVTNWTTPTLTGRVKVPVGVAYDSDPRQVETILREIADAHPMVLANPAPAVVFLGFGADSMDFEIRAILRDVNWMLSAKSDMNFEIVRRFREAGIEIPFAQREITIKNAGEIGGGS